ncbi:hypothetical protein FCM35_KLT22156 [Carex littledalei]|uniref:Uncharacterized protein n=1 Tax=Carex littledalei TaxID=544730 RepID=A0A833QH22_9POAL|nr:hypothetical protein FCM35_KLT22156 [Carex littledalei]
MAERLPIYCHQRKYVEMADRARAELSVLQGQESLLPMAIPITKVAGIDMAVENVGPALEFLEHCRNFSQTVYNLKDGEAERILDEIIKGWDGSSGQLSVLEEFQRDLLTIILTDKKTRRSSSSGSSLAGDAWVAAVERLIDLESLFRNVPRDYFQSGSCYHQLDANWKLHILNFLCDLVLVTKKLKRFRPIPREKEFNWKELPASQKVIALWKELKDEEAKAVQPPEDGMVLSFEEEEEYERRLSALKEEFRKAYLEMAFEQYRGDDGPIDIPRLDLQWEEPTWRQQRDNWECGYYVMKYMHSFVTNHQNNFPNEWFPNDPRPYTLEDVDGIASMCSVFCEKCLKNASN